MKVLNKIYILLLTLPILAGVVSCKEAEAEYSPAEQLTNAQVYFSSETSKTIDVSSDASSFNLPIYRQNTAGELVMPIAARCSSDMFSVPSSATFADGANSGAIAITYDPSKIEVGHYDTISISFNKEYGTPYGSNTITVLVGQAEPWISLGLGQFCDNFMDEDVFYEVEIERNALYPNRYRVVDPYGEMYGKPNRDPYFYFYVCNEGDPVMGSYTAPFTGYAYYDQCNTGYYYGDGYGYYMPMPTCKFKLGCGDAAVESLNCVADYFENGDPAYIKFTSVYGLSEYGGAWDYSTEDGLIKVVMPGYELADYSSNVIYAGYFVDTDNVPYAVANVTWGADVKSAQLALLSEDGATVYESKEIESAGEYRMALPEGVTGKFCFLLDVYDADGTVQGTTTAEFKFNGLGNTEETWSPAFTGIYNYGLSYEGVSDDDYYANYWKYGFYYYGTDDEAILYVSDADQSRYKISPWNNGELIFTYTEDGVIISDETCSGELGSWGTFYGSEASFLQSVYGMEIPQSSYDGQTGTFYFNVAYDDASQYYVWVEESFTLTGYASANVRKAFKVARKASSTTKKDSKKVVERKKRVFIPVDRSKTFK